MMSRKKKNNKLAVIKEQKTDPVIKVPGLQDVPKVDLAIKPNYELLIHLLNQRTHSYSDEQNKFISYLQDMFKTKGADTFKDKYGNLYVVKGKADFYPCVVAHTDINQSKVAGSVVMQAYPWIFGFDTVDGEQCGIGADDKVGVYFAIHMFDLFDNIKLFFPKDEEVGLVGTNKAKQDFFQDCSMLVQLDRNSYNNDLITYTNGIEVCSNEFVEAADSIMNKYMYATSRGSCTDIGGIKKFKTVNCVAMNVSCGYINEHSGQEIISMPHFENAINFGYELLQLGVTKVWPHTSKEEVFSYGNWRKFSSKSSFDDVGYPQDLDPFASNGVRYFDEIDTSYTAEGPLGKVTIPSEYREQDFFIAESYPDLMNLDVRKVALEHSIYLSEDDDYFHQLEIDECLSDGFCPSCCSSVEVDNRLLLYTECQTCNSRFNIPTDNYYEGANS